MHAQSNYSVLINIIRQTCFEKDTHFIILQNVEVKVGLLTTLCDAT